MAINNVKTMVDCAKDAGVRKIVFFSHTNADPNSPYSYIMVKLYILNIKLIQGKGKCEEYIKSSGLEYAFVKPCTIFGDTPDESIVLNNIAYLLRTFPIFTIPGNIYAFYLFLRI